MNITIPVYIEQLPQAEQTPPLYSVRPLFFFEPVVRAEELQRAIARFVKQMRRELNDQGRAIRHDTLAALGFAPEIEDHFLKLDLDLKTRTAHCRFLFVVLHQFDRRVAFTPGLPQLWFELTRGEDLQTRATEVLTQYFRGKEKHGIEPVPRPEDVSAQGKSWTSTVEIEIQPPLLGKTPREELRAMLGGNESLDGETELYQVGRCLDWLYPDELNRLVGRQPEIEELIRLLESADRRPVLLVGPRQVGKTALIEEFVFRKVARHQSPYQNKNNVWLLAPQRLISGMSYVGQWENRLLAILQEAKTRDHILYFDDLVGLFKAGISRDANLSVAQVLKPYLERRDVRMLGEITPEAWRVLREQDRGFADLFQVLPVLEPSEEETLEMLLGLTRQLEHQHRCRFELDVLPAVIDLQRRYVREAAFPGKAATFLRQLAVTRQGGPIFRYSALWEFQAKSGLSLWFLDESSMTREEVTDSLQAQVKGQPAAIEALTDAILIAKARLNDPDRPIASFLFLGPTGVGKTESAKALSSFLFESEDRLLRFDMNEFVSSDAVARLAGTFDQPEGLLTSAVRRQPFSVILLDEIEKAHPDVFNLLLQVMGDGRLTDALGRTADFSNTILILTSNLGVKEAASELGFATQSANETSIYAQAAQRFFAPEFFNRLDRVVPFGRLSEETVKEIAARLIWNIFHREGLQRRRCTLIVYQTALDRIVKAGYHPQLGARALKRAVEKQVTQAMAGHLATLTSTEPMLIEVWPTKNDLHIHLKELREAPPHPNTDLNSLLEDPAAAVERLTQFLERTDEELSALQPTGAISLDALQPEHYRYFALREQLGRLRHLVERLENHLASAARAATRLTRNYPRPPRRPQEMTLHSISQFSSGTPRHEWKKIFAADDINAYLQELAQAPHNDEQGLQEHLAEVAREAALLSALVHSAPQEEHSAALLLLHSLHSWSDDDCREELKKGYEEMCRTLFGWEVTLLDEQELKEGASEYRNWLYVSGPLAASLLAHERGTHLNIQNGHLLPLLVKVFPLAPGQAPGAVLDELLIGYDAWFDELAERESLTADDLAQSPMAVHPVTRVYNRTGRNFGSTLDVRSGLVAQGFPTAKQMRTFLLAGLPLPPELQ